MKFNVLGHYTDIVALNTRCRVVTWWLFEKMGLKILFEGI